MATVARLLRTVGLESIRNRIVAFALAATVIPAFTTAWISYRQNERSLRAKISEELNGAASQSAREVSDDSAAESHQHRAAVGVLGEQLAGQSFEHPQRF